MEYPSEDQLNKLISAYNDDYDSLGVDEEMRKSVLQIAEFEEKLKGKCATQSEPRIQKTEKSVQRSLKQFEQIRIPDMPEHMRKRVAEERIAEIEEPEAVRETKRVVEPQVQVQYLTDSEAVDKKLKELVAKNKNLSLALQKEQSGSAALRDQVEKLNKRTEELKRVALGANEQTLVHKLEETTDKVKKTEEKNASLNLRVSSLEQELAKMSKVLKREVGDKADVDELLREDGNWVGRAQQIEILKTKMHRLKSKVEGLPDKSPKVKSLTVNSDKTEEIVKLRKEVESLSEEKSSLTIKLKSITARTSTLEEQVRKTRMDAEEQRKLLLEKSSNDDKYIQALKKEIQKMKDSGPKENRLWSSNSISEGLQPLKTDYVKKITTLEKEVEKWRQECKKMEQSSMISLGKSDNLIDLSRENYKLRLKIHELESRVFKHS